MGEGEDRGREYFDLRLGLETRIGHVAIVGGDHELSAILREGKQAIVDERLNECIFQHGALPPPLVLHLDGIGFVAAHDWLFRLKSFPGLQVDLVLAICHLAEVDAVFPGKLADTDPWTGRL